MPVKPILYVRLPNWIGDVCMSLPSLEALLATGLPVVACARPWARDLLAGYALHGFVDMHKGWRRNRHDIRQAVRAGGKSPRQGLLLPDSLSSALSFRLAGIPSAGYRDDGRSLLLRWPIAKPDQPMHAVQSWYHLTRQTLAAWNLPLPAPAPRQALGLVLTERHRQEAHAMLAAHGLTPGTFILIAPTATGLHHGQVKVWPEFDALTRNLQALGHVVAMCPPPAEIDAAHANAPTALCLPPLGLGAFATLAGMAALVICNDSGVSHLAAAVQARQLTLFGVTDAARTGPWSDQATCLGQAGQWPSLEQAQDRAMALLR